MKYEKKKDFFLSHRNQTKQTETQGKKRNNRDIKLTKQKKAVLAPHLSIITLVQMNLIQQRHTVADWIKK